MAESRPKGHKVSRRSREQELLLQDALARPGVREVMKVYGGWQEKNRSLEAYRSVVEPEAQIKNSNSSQAY